MFARSLVIFLAAAGALIITAGLVVGYGIFSLLYFGDGLVLEKGLGFGASAAASGYAILFHTALGLVCIGLAQQINQTRAP